MDMFRSMLRRFSKSPALPASQEKWDEILRGYIGIPNSLSTIEYCLGFMHDPDYTAYLKLALEEGKNCKCVELFLRKGARLEGPEWEAESPAEIVFKRDIQPEFCKKLFKLLLDYGLECRYRNVHGENLLHMFAHHVSHDSADIAEMILNEGVPVDEMDRFGWSPLLSAVLGKHAQLAKLLIDKGADVNKKSTDGSVFPLYCAAQNTMIGLLDLLLSSGADVNAENCNGNTALHAACIFKREPVINYLVRRGADVSARNSNGSTPFSFLDL